MPTNRDRYTASMSEAAMLKTLRDYTLFEGGFFWHVRDARAQDVEGLTDTIILLPPRYGVHPGIVGFFEVKTQGDRVSPVQRKVIHLLGQASEIAYGIVRPRPKNLAEITLDDALALLGKEEV